MIWNVIANTIDNNHVVPSKNQPNESGEYLCTCVKKYFDKDGNTKLHHYLRMMAYDNEKNYWHDLGHKYSTSHIIIAWTDDVALCDFSEYYISGGEAFLK